MITAYCTKIVWVSAFFVGNFRVLGLAVLAGVVCHEWGIEEFVGSDLDFDHINLGLA